jgi:tRNA(fMet)-specific endonuclease VapC
VEDEDDPAIAAVTVAELLVGVELAARGQRAARAGYVEHILDLVPVEAYTMEVARAHAALLVAARRFGRPRRAHDLVIAATAAATHRHVVSTDRGGFDDLPGVHVRALDAP